MTNAQMILTVVIIMAATMLTRFLSFLVFPAGKQTPAFVRYLGKVLPAAAMSMLVIYCYKGVDLTAGNHGAPELLAGVKAIISDRDWSLSYEGETLNIAPLSEEELSPAVCLPRLMDALRSGWLLEENRETWNGEACIRLLVDQSGASGGKVVSAFWLREEDAVPLHAELAVGEETVFTVAFTEFDFDDTIEGMEAAASER